MKPTAEVGLLRSIKISEQYSTNRIIETTMRLVPSPKITKFWD